MTIAIIIIVILSLAVVFLLWVLRVVLRQNEGKDYTREDMIDFAQSQSNNEVTVYDLGCWVNEGSVKMMPFSDN